MLPIPIMGGMGGSARLGKLQSMVRLGAVRLGNSNGNILSISNQSHVITALVWDGSDNTYNRIAALLVKIV